jgi:hypothetical protein
MIAIAAAAVQSAAHAHTALAVAATATAAAATVCAAAAAITATTAATTAPAAPKQPAKKHTRSKYGDVSDTTGLRHNRRERSLVATLLTRLIRLYIQMQQYASQVCLA